MNRKTFLEEIHKRQQIKIPNDLLTTPIIYKCGTESIGFIGFLNHICVCVYNELSYAHFKMLNLDSDTFYCYLQKFKIKPEKFLKDLDLLILENL